MNTGSLNISEGGENIVPNNARPLYLNTNKAKFTRSSFANNVRTLRMNKPQGRHAERSPSPTPRTAEQLTIRRNMGVKTATPVVMPGKMFQRSVGARNLTRSAAAARRGACALRKRRRTGHRQR